MITTDGKVHIKRYLAGFVPGIAQSVAFGVGGGAEAVGDVRLGFEVGRTDITLTSYDFVNNKLIFKAPVPDEFGGKIYEVALYSQPADYADAEFGSRLITTFDSATEEWLEQGTTNDSVFNGTNSRVGVDSLRQTPIASATRTDSLRDISMDLSGYSAADRFTLALNAGNTNTTSIRIRLFTDTTNYYDLNFGSPASGYSILGVNKGDATVNGTPNWANITEIRAITIASAGGAAQIDFDGLRIEDTDTINSDYVMVSRELLAAPFTKLEGTSQEVEFALDVNV